MALNSRAGWAGTGVLGAMALGLTLAAGAPPSAQRTAVTATDAREWWLTIVIDPSHGQGTAWGTTGLTPAFAASLSPHPRLFDSECMGCFAWFPISVATPWTEVDRQATKVAAVAKGADGTIDAVPYQLSAQQPAVKAWYWGPDDRGPEGASEWRNLVSGPQCNCCDPNCKPPVNDEIRQRGFGIELHVRSSQPRVNWSAASALPWSSPSSVEAPFLAPAPFIESDSAAVQEFVRVNAPNPKSSGPWRTALALARSAAARSAPIVREPGAGAPSADDRAATAPPAAYRGLRVAGADACARSGKGTVHDAHCLSVAAMRAVGIPARVAIGWEIDDSPGALTQIAELTTWGEFWVGGAGWVPFDCREMRKDAAGNPPPGSRIDGFGEPANHSRRIAWSWWFNPPFERAMARTTPAGFGMAPCTMPNVVPPPNAPHPLAWVGAVGATARSSRGVQAMYPGEAGLKRR